MKKEKKNKTLFSKTIKVIVEVLVLVIIVIIIFYLGMYYYDNKYSYRNFASHEICQVYGINFKPTKIEKENYCCRKSDDKNYINCIKVDY